jgi:hypothetical protein
LCSGIICLALIPFFLGAVHFFDYIAFENFIVRLTMTKFVGYPIPELFGSGTQDSLQDNISKFENVFVGILSFYGLFLISLSYIKSSAVRWKGLSLSLGIPFLLSLLGLWIKFIRDDHIIGPFEKHQLFQFTYILIIATSICFFIALRKPKVKRRKRGGIPAPRDTTLTQVEGSQIETPSAEPMLKDNNESSDLVTPEQGQESDLVTPEQGQDSEQPLVTPDNDLMAENASTSLTSEEDNLERESTSSENVQDEESSNDSSMQREANSEEEVAQDILPPIDSGISLDDTSSPEEPPIDLSENPTPTGKSNPEAPAVNP